MNKDKQNEKEGTNNISKPNAPMIGANGNIFAQMGIANRALRESGQSDKISEMNARVMNSDSYNSALSIICEYVNPVEQDGKSKEYER